MQIKTRLTLLFTSLIAALLLAFALTVYFTSSATREEEYFKRLKQQGATKANLLFDTKIAPGILQIIYKKAPNALYQEEVAVYDTSFNLLYHDAVDIDKVKETRGMTDSIIASKQMQFYINDMQVVGFIYEHDNKQYIITSASIDGYGLAKLANLRNTLLMAFLISVVVIFFVGRFFAKGICGLMLFIRSIYRSAVPWLPGNGLLLVMQLKPVPNRSTRLILARLSIWGNNRFAWAPSKKHCPAG